MSESQPKAREGEVLNRLPNGRFQKGHALGGPGNTSSRINVPALAKRKAEELGLDLKDLVWEVVLAMLYKGACGDVPAAKLVHDLLGEQEPSGPLVAIGIGNEARVPQAPPLYGSGGDGAPPIGEHLKRLAAIIEERGLATADDMHPAEVVATIANRSAEEELLS
jgi:hypothetical protein